MTNHVRRLLALLLVLLTLLGQVGTASADGEPGDSPERGGYLGSGN